MRHGVGFQHFTFGRHGRLELVEQPRFAGSRFRDRRNDLPMTTARQFERMRHLPKLALAPDKLRQAAPHRYLEMAARRSRPDHLVNVDWLANAFDFSRPEVAQFEVTLDQMPRILANYDATRRRDRLHPRRQVAHMSHGRVLGVPARVDHAQNYFARVDPDTDLDS